MWWDRVSPTPESTVRATAIILAGGIGQRLGRSGGKQMALVAGEPVLAHTVRAFDEASTVDTIVLVCHPDRVSEYLEAVEQAVAPRTRVLAVAGGSTRQESARSGLSAVSDRCGIVAVHDGARPLITAEAIDAAIVELAMDESVDGIVIGHPSYDTVKLVEGDRVVGTPPREQYWAAQTPQVFRCSVLREAYRDAEKTGRTGTDDSSLVEAVGGTVRMLEGSRENIKVTVDADLAFAEAVLAARRG